MNWTCLIFDRGKKPISTTEVGMKIVAQAKNIVNEAERIKDIVDQEKGYIGGEYVSWVLFQQLCPHSCRCS